MNSYPGTGVEKNLIPEIRLCYNESLKHVMLALGLGVKQKLEGPWWAFQWKHETQRYCW